MKGNIFSYFWSMPSILKTSTFKESSLTFTSTFINGLLGMVFYILVARNLGPSDFGIFSLSLVILALIADIGNLGINTGIVNFVSKYHKSDPNASDQYLKLSFVSKIVLSIFFLILGIVLSPFISVSIFAKPELIEPLRIVSIGLAATWLFSFTTSYYQAKEKFLSWGLIQISANSLRLLILVYFIFSSQLNVNSALLSYILTLFIAFLISLINIPLGFLKAKTDEGVKKNLFNYNKWMALSTGVAAFSSRSDTFILGRLESTSGVGIYSAANQLVQVVPQLIGAIGTVIAPKLSSFRDDGTMLLYVKKLQFFVLGISAVILFSLPVVKIIISSFFGPGYINSFPVFVILLFAMLIFLISIPTHNAIIYYYQYPKLFSYLSFLNVLVMIISAYYFTSLFGYKATAYSVLISNGLNFVIPVIWFLKKLRI